MGHARGEERIGVEMGLVDRIRVNAREVEKVSHYVGTERATINVLPRRSNGDQVARIGGSHRLRECPRPGGGVSIGRVRKEPVRRLRGQVPGYNRRPMLPFAS